MGRLEGEERVLGAPGQGAPGTRPRAPSTVITRAPVSQCAPAAQSVIGPPHPAPGLRPSNARAVRQATLLGAQRTVGNATVAHMLQAERSEPPAVLEPTVRPETTVRPEPASLTEIDQRARSVTGATIAAAGVPVAAAPPDGARAVASHSSGGTLAGYTGIKDADAFTAPRLVIRTSGEIDGAERRYYGEVEPTSTADATHECYYLAAGDHHSLVPRDYWRVSPQISRLLRAGEQEHLDDARLAFNLTYGLIARRINALAGQKFGPAGTPAEAEALAEAQVRRRLPDALGTDPLTWFTALDEMLRMSRHRDYRGWHEVDPSGVPSDGTQDTYRPLRPTAQTRIGVVPSEAVVSYPGSD